jgi:paraquat-inducible protein A
MTHPVLSAHDAGLAACSYCGLVCRTSAAKSLCPRCGGSLHSRNIDSLSRCSAFLIAAAILYIPANLLPVMETSSLFGAEKDTILNGIVYFWSSGSQGLAALIFFVSILVPMLKLGTLSTLVWSVHRRSSSHRHERATLFRVVELFGRWSMLDVFVVALMVGLVHFRGLAVIEAGPGAAAFGAVVVLTMLASRSFDPRLIWDHVEESDD